VSCRKKKPALNFTLNTTWQQDDNTPSIRATEHQIFHASTKQWDEA